MLTKYVCCRCLGTPGNVYHRQRLQVLHLISRRRQYDLYLRVLSVRKVMADGVPADLKEDCSHRCPTPTLDHILRLLSSTHAASCSMMAGVVDLLEQLCTVADGTPSYLLGSSSRWMWSLFMVHAC